MTERESKLFFSLSLSLFFLLSWNNRSLLPSSQHFLLSSTVPVFRVFSSRGYLLPPSRYYRFCISYIPTTAADGAISVYQHRRTELRHVLLEGHRPVFAKSFVIRSPSSACLVARSKVGSLTFRCLLLPFFCRRNDLTASSTSRRPYNQRVPVGSVYVS